MFGSYSYPTKREPMVSPCGKYITMPDGSRFKRTVLRSSASQTKPPSEDQDILDELETDDQAVTEITTDATSL